MKKVRKIFADINFWYIAKIANLDYSLKTISVDLIIHSTFPLAKRHRSGLSEEDYGGVGVPVLRELCSEYKYRQLRQKGQRTEGNNLRKEA